MYAVSPEMSMTQQGSSPSPPYAPDPFDMTRTQFQPIPSAWQKIDPDRRVDFLPQPYRRIDRVLQDILSICDEKIDEIEKKRANAEHESPSLLSVFPTGVIDAAPASCIVSDMNSNSNRLYLGGDDGSISVVDSIRKAVITSVHAFQQPLRFMAVATDSISNAYTTIVSAPRVTSKIHIYRMYRIEQKLRLESVIELPDLDPKSYGHICGLSMSKDATVLGVTFDAGCILVYQLPGSTALKKDENGDDRISTESTTPLTISSPSMTVAAPKRAEPQSDASRPPTNLSNRAESTQTSAQGGPGNASTGSSTVKDTTAKDTTAKDSSTTSKKGASSAAVSKEEKAAILAQQQLAAQQQQEAERKAEIEKQNAEKLEKTKREQFDPFALKPVCMFLEVPVQHPTKPLKSKLTHALLAYREGHNVVDRYSITNISTKPPTVAPTAPVTTTPATVQPAPTTAKGKSTEKNNSDKTDKAASSVNQAVGSANTVLPEPKIPSQSWTFPFNVTCSCLSENTSLLGLGLSDGTVLLWDNLLGIQRLALDRHKQAVKSVSFYREKYLFSGGMDGFVHIYDLTTGALLYRRMATVYSTPVRLVHCATDLPLGLVLDDMGEARVFDLKHGKKLCKLGANMQRETLFKWMWKYNNMNGVEQTQGQQIAIVAEITDHPVTSESPMNRFTMQSQFTNSVDDLRKVRAFSEAQHSIREEAEDQEDELGVGENGGREPTCRIVLFRYQDLLCSAFPALANRSRNLYEDETTKNLFVSLRLEELEDPQYGLGPPLLGMSAPIPMMKSTQAPSLRSQRSSTSKLSMGAKPPSKTNRSVHVTEPAKTSANLLAPGNKQTSFRGKKLAGTRVSALTAENLNPRREEETSSLIYNQFEDTTQKLKARLQNKKVRQERLEQQHNEIHQRLEDEALNQKLKQRKENLAKT
eukprot:GILJ01005161.1.p1 GENE.GILJ01005161.1~~GILJ01005161.1.p1  ORF type:complete len:926 (+),score=185.38 GILJ01005161.1:131-2908(+)